jgi:hypothetical protein
MPFSTWYHEPDELRQSRWQLAALVTGVLGPPLFWLAGFEIAYVLAVHACRTQLFWWLLAAAWAPLLPILGIAVWILVTHRGAWRGSTASWPSWLAVLGLASCGWFAIVTLSMGIPVLWLNPCG